MRDIHPALLIVFGIVITIMLLLDLGIFNKKNHVVSTKEATIWTFVWIGLSMCFSIFIYFDLGQESFTEYQGAYWIEKALSIDNLFVFVLVFSQFKIPPIYQHKVLFWGILGALLFRGFFIFAGVQLIARTNIFVNLFGERELNWVLIIFGFFLVYSGISSTFKKETSDDDNYKENAGARFVRKIFKVSKNFDGAKFFTKKNGIRMATPLFMALAVIEFTDIVFAVDSVPAIFSISKDPIILYTSNIFAILGLRSMYFILANLVGMFRHLKYSLGAILVFIGCKMIFEPFVHISSAVSLIIIASLLIISILSSLMTTAQENDSTPA